MASGFLHRPRLGHEIALVLVVKLLVLFVIWIVWFAQPQAPTLNAEQVAGALYSSSPATQKGTDSHVQP